MATIKVNDYKIDNARGLFFMLVKKVDRTLMSGSFKIKLSGELFDLLSDKPMEYPVENVNSDRVSIGYDPNLTGVRGYVEGQSITIEIADGFGYVHYDG